MVASLQANEAADEPLSPINVSALDADWQALFDLMHAVDYVAAPFTEERYFTFRRTPKAYAGIFRKDPDGHVSLAYTTPETVALHLGEGFAFYRKGEGTVRRIPQSNSQSDTLALFPKLLNFDLVSVSAFYDLSGELNDLVWRLNFDAKPAFADEVSYQQITISGDATAVQRIELIKSAKQRVVIMMGDPVYPKFYLPEIKAKYFFTTESE